MENNLVLSIIFCILVMLEKTIKKYTIKTKNQLSIKK